MHLQVSDLERRQRVMREGLEHIRREGRQQLLRTVSDMRASARDPGRWRPRTQCRKAPLSEMELLQLFNELTVYWRQPQNWTDSPDKPSIVGAAMNVWRAFGAGEPLPETWVGPPVHDAADVELLGRLRHPAGPRSDFREACVTRACWPPLLAGFTCGAASSR